MLNVNDLTALGAVPAGLLVAFGARTRSLFFFFQAEDGIRDDLVTGVQTCALPILPDAGHVAAHPAAGVRQPPANLREPRNGGGGDADAALPGGAGKVTHSSQGSQLAGGEVRVDAGEDKIGPFFLEPFPKRAGLAPF